MNNSENIKKNHKVTIVRCQHDDAEMFVDNPDDIPTEDYYFESAVSAEDVCALSQAAISHRIVFHNRTWYDYERKVFCSKGKVAKKVN